MLNRLLVNFTRVLMLTAVGMMLFPQSSTAQCGYASLKHNRTQFRDALGNPVQVAGQFTGALEWLPSDYATSGATTYPTFIYFGGLGSIGDGTPGALCQLFYDQNQSLPSQLENGNWPATVSPGGVGTARKYIVLSVQYRNYDFNAGDYPRGDHVEALLNYLLPKYKIDPNRIYLTGMSSGANIAMEYAGSSLARAQRITAVSAASLCAPLLPNNASGGANIANAMLPVWMIHCDTDAAPCTPDRPQSWYDAINANEPVPNPNLPVYTRLNNANPTEPMRCHGFAHDTWSRLYSPTFEPNGVNFMEWSLSFSNAALPVTMKSFDVNLSNGKVHLKWTTLTERDNASFTIERSADGLTFQSIGSVKGSGNSTTERNYSYTDDAPLNNISYYRLLQSDNSGPHDYSVIKKVFNRAANAKRLIVSPNPITTELSAFIQVDKKQRVLITLTDMNGRRITQLNNFFDQGNTEFTIPTGSLNKGIYLLRVSGETISETHKVIRQ